MARNLSTKYHNNKPANQCGCKKGDKRKRDDSKSEDKDSNTCGTAGAPGAHIEDTTINEDSNAPSGGASLGAHVLETIYAPSRPSRKVDEMLGAHLVNDDF